MIFEIAICRDTCVCVFVMDPGTRRSIASSPWQERKMFECLRELQYMYLGNEGDSAAVVKTLSRAIRCPDHAVDFFLLWATETLGCEKLMDYIFKHAMELKFKFGGFFAYVYWHPARQRLTKDAHKDENFRVLSYLMRRGFRLWSEKHRYVHVLLLLKF